MKVGTVKHRGRLLAAAVLDDEAYDLTRLFGIGPAPENDPLGHYLRKGVLNYADMHEALQSATLRNTARLDASVDALDWVLPFRPGKIIAVGRNYAAHARELGNEVPESPVLFSKSPSTCIGPGQTIRIDPTEGRVDYEGEIAVVIGAKSRALSEHDTRGAVCGVTLLNDVTARDVQRRAKEQGLPWFEAKNRDTFCPVGPLVTMTGCVPQPFEWPIETRVNGELRQAGNTGDFIFPVERLISHISRRITLAPGDIIATGTPEGVGPLSPGDTVTIMSPQIGSLVNTVEVAIRHN